MRDSEPLWRRLGEAHHEELMNGLLGASVHDLNNLLTAIQGYSELAAERVAEGHPARASLANLSHAVSEAGRVAANLLRFFGRGARRIEQLNVRDVVSRALLHWRRVLPEELEVREEWSEGGAPLWAGVNRAEFQVLLMGLFARLIQGLDGRGTLRVAAPVPVVRHDPVKLWLGADSMTPREDVQGSAGTLAGTVEEELARELDIELGDFRGDAGAMGFLLVFPVLAQPRSPGWDAEAAGRGQRILLAESSENVRRLMVGCLHSAGYQVEVVDGDQVAERMANGQGDLAIIEAQEAPALVGLSAPVLVLGELGSQEAPPGARTLRKPFSVSQLLREVSELLAKG